MRALRSIVAKRITATILLVSLLSLLASPLLRSDQYTETSRYAEWVRMQLGDISSEAVEIALASAVDTDTDQLDVFIEAFVDAYAVASRDSEAEPVAHGALFGLLQHRYGLLYKAVAPHLLLKSALIRTLSLQERAGSSFWGSIDGSNAANIVFRLSTFLSCQLPFSSAAQINSISPRGP